MTRHSVLASRVWRARSRGVGAGTRRQIFQAEIIPDAVLQMDDQIAFLQIGEINVERGAGRQRVRRFQPARTLDFVAAKNLRIRDDDEFCVVADESRVRASRFGSGVWRLASGVLLREHLHPAPRPQNPDSIPPDFLKPLPFAVVVAEDVDGVILPQPAVELLEKFPALRLGDLRFRRALGQRAEGVKTIGIVDCRFPTIDWLRLIPTVFRQFN